MSIPPALVDPARFQEKKFKRAALIVRVAQGFQQEQEALQSADLYVALLLDEPETAERLLQSTAANRAPTPANEAFLLALWRQLPAEHWRIRRQLIAEINGCINQRRSAISAPGKWEQLGLPKVRS